MRLSWTPVLAMLLLSRGAFAQNTLPPLPPPPGEAAPLPAPAPPSGVEYAPAPSSDIVYSPAPPSFVPPAPDPPVEPPPPYPPPIAAPRDDGDPPWARGLYLRMGLGVNVVVLQEATPQSNDTRGAFGFMTDVALGGTVVNGLSIAAVVTGGQGYVRDFGNADEQVEFLGLGGMVDWHPSRTLGWHVGGAIALGVLEIRTRGTPDHPTSVFAPSPSGTSNTSVASNTDAQLSVLGGYDWRLSRRWAVGVQARFTYCTATTLHVVADDDGTRAAATAFALEGSILF